MNKLLIICGPTATGKTNLALQLIKLFPASIISADSRQVYRDMDIGTGKDKPSDGIEIAGYDLVNPDEDFSVAHFYRFAWDTINKLWSHHKLPIIVGGTGQYLSSLTNPPASIFIKPNLVLRQQLNPRSLVALQAELKKVDLKKWQGMNRSDQLNPRRLIRAIEIATFPQGLSLQTRTVLDHLDKKPHILCIGLTAPLKIMDQHINERVIERARGGMSKEVKTLMKQYPQWDSPAFSATGYREWRDYLEGKTTKNQAIELWQQAEHQYARRQLTWFKKQPGIHWFDIGKPDWQKTLVEQAKNWYANS